MYLEHCTWLHRYMRAESLSYILYAIQIQFHMPSAMGDEWDSNLDTERPIDKCIDSRVTTLYHIDLHTMYIQL